MNVKFVWLKMIFSITDNVLDKRWNLLSAPPHVNESSYCGVHDRDIFLLYHTSMPLKSLYWEERDIFLLYHKQATYGISLNKEFTSLSMDFVM